MAEKCFPRGGGESADGNASGKRKGSQGTSAGPRRIHKKFSETGEAGDAGADVSHTERVVDRESNIFTKLKKQKLSRERRKAAVKEQKKNRPKPEQLVRDEEKIIEHLSYTTLVPGMVLLGRIKEFLGSELLLTLPGGLRGFVNPFDISDAFSQRLRSLEHGTKSEDGEIQKLLGFFPPGRMMICKIKSIAKDPTKSAHNHERITVHLTLNPRDILAEMSQHLFNGTVIPAAIASVEEHGYAMDVGLEAQSIRAFLPRAKGVVEDEVNAPVMEAGQVVMCCVEAGGLSNKNNTVRALQLNRNVTAVEFAGKNISPANLLPGAIVDVVVEKVMETGLRVACGSVQGFVSRFHLIGPIDSLENHNEKEKMAARVLYSNPVTKQTAFSLKTSLWNAQTWNQISHGDLYEGVVIQEATVLAAVENVGVYFTLNETRVAFASRKNLGIPPTDSVKMRFKAGTQHPCVVVGFNDLDEIVLVSLKHSLISQPLLSYHDVKVGQVLECKVRGLVPGGVVVVIGERIQGFVPAAHLTEVPLKQWEKKFRDNMQLTCRVMDVDPERRSLVLTHKKSLLDSKEPVLQSYEDADAGKVFTGVIGKIRDSGMLIRFFQRVHGWVPATEFVEGISLENLYYEGQTVRCKVLRCDKKTSNLQLSLRLIKADAQAKMQESSGLASIVQCRVNKITPTGLEVRLITSEANGFIPLVHLSDTPSSAPPSLSTFQVNQLIKTAVVIKLVPLTFSIKPSYIEAAEHHDVPTAFEDFHLGRETVATVNNIKNYGVFVEVANGVGGLLPKRLMTDSAMELHLGDSVLVKTEQIDEEKRRVLFRMVKKIGDDASGASKAEKPNSKSAAKPSADEKPPVNLGKHSYGDIVSAKIIAVEKTRLKIRTTAKMVGYIRQTELCDQANNKKAKLEFYHVNQIVIARVIGMKMLPVRMAKGKRILTKKVIPKPPVYDFSIRHTVLAAKDVEELRQIVKEEKTGSGVEIKVEPDAEFVGLTVTDRSIVELKNTRKTKKQQVVPSTNVTSLLAPTSLPAFSWDEENTAEVDSGVDFGFNTGSEDESSRKRRKLSRTEERKTYDNERIRDVNGNPLETVDDFEKLVLTTPNDSMAWIRFMAFYLEKRQIPEAKAVGQRALKAVSFRDETEKFNIWIALLNLENLHGTKDSLEDVLQNAIQHNDPLKIYRQMAAIFVNTGKHEQAEATYKKMTGRFKDVKEVWMDYGGYLMKTGKNDEAHQLMQRSLKILDAKSQVDVIVKFALLELQHGSKERAKTMFENLVANYPRRTDLLHMYLSQLIKAQESPPVIRNLFERIIVMKFPAKKMKTFFKRYMEYEEQHGNAATLEHAKAEAQRWVQEHTESV
ncbi:protein RRP5 homolog [Paramacrobiotus metropolitanus]|uniref:protein RRP5 homolog n=1 Tax=Paramacrobiotus metropolitanus TaxID=2943436 RepID=UPI00244614ED|nr:protein RRP5 homolog [Paramacrobiotus metropolitanus]